MTRIVIRIRPAEVMDDLDLDIVRERAALLREWQAEVKDSRLGDAPYVTVVATTPVVTAERIAELKGALGELPRMRALVWLSPTDEVPLDVANAATFQVAAREEGA